MTINIKENIAKFYNTIFERLSESQYLKNLLETAENKTGIPAPYIVSGITTLLLLIFALGFGPFVLCDVVVIFYPAYRSYEALEEQHLEKCLHWIKYWIVFGVFRATEHIGDSLLWWLPGYILLKFFFLLWCLSPMENNGTTFIYDTVIRPTFQHNAETMDDVIKSVKRMSTYGLTEE